MNRNRWMLLPLLGLLSAIALTIASHLLPLPHSVRSEVELSAMAQSPPSLQAPAAETTPTLSPTSPNALPAPPTPPPPPPASTAPPLPLAGEYSDPAGQFKVGLLKDYRVTPLAGSVLVEALNGNVAYAVVAQSQPVSNPIGLTPGLNTQDLVQVATAVFQRGEGFQPGTAQPEAGGGAVMNWTGSLTIAGKTQPVSGVILVRPNPKTILLLLVAATQAGSAQVPGAVSALSNSLQA